MYFKSNTLFFYFQHDVPAARGGERRELIVYDGGGLYITSVAASHLGPKGLHWV